MSKKDKLVN